MKKENSSNENKNEPNTHTKANNFIVGSRLSFEKVGQFFGVFAAFLTFIFSTVFYISGYQEDIRTFREIETEQTVDLRIIELEAKINALIQDVSDFQPTIGNISELPEEAALYLKIENIQNEVKSIRNQLQIIETIETAVTSNPERAMSIPILRRDIDGLKDSVAEDLAATRNEIDRLYGLSQWFIGLMATMALGVLGIAVGNAFRNGKS